MSASRSRTRCPLGLVDHRQQQRGLAGEVEVDRPPGHAGRRSDLLEAGCMQPSLLPKSSGRFNDRLPRKLGSP